MRSYRTISTLPDFSAVGGLLSVALSLESPPPDVIRHRVSVEPGLSSHLRATRESGRPSGQLTHEGFVLTARNVNLAEQGGQNRFAFAIPAAINPGGTKMALESLNHDIWRYVHVWGQPVTEDAQTGFEG